MQEAQNTVNYNVFVLGTHHKHIKNQPTSAQNGPSRPYLAASTVLFHVGRTFDPQKRQNTVFCHRTQRPQYLNTGIYAVFSMLQAILFHAKATKNAVNYNVLAFSRHQNNSKRWPTLSQTERRPIGWKYTKKCENTTGVKDFGEGLQPGRVAGQKYG